METYSFRFHLSERTTRRIMAILPHDHEPTWQDFKAAYAQIEREDVERDSKAGT